MCRTGEWKSFTFFLRWHNHFSFSPKSLGVGSGSGSEPIFRNLKLLKEFYWPSLQGLVTLGKYERFSLESQLTGWGTMLRMVSLGKFLKFFQKSCHPPGHHWRTANAWMTGSMVGTNHATSSEQRKFPRSAKLMQGSATSVFASYSISSPYMEFRMKKKKSIPMHGVVSRVIFIL